MRKIFFLLCCCSYALFPQPAAGNTDSLRTYYTYVHKAERGIMSGQYRRAIESYDSAAAFWAHPFAGDVYNKLRCCILIKDFQAAQPEVERLVTKGAQLQFFSTAFYDDFRKSDVYTHLTASYPALRKKYVATVDEQALKQIRILNDADQAVHCMLPALYADTAFVMRMRRNDDSLSLLLMNLLQCADCLGDDKLGCNFHNDTSLSPLPVYGTIVLHQIQKGGYNFNGLIYQAVLQGKLRAEIALSWLTNSNMLPVNLTNSYQIYADTLWKYRESGRYKSSPGSLAVRARNTDSILKAFFLDDACFDVEERVKFNYRQACKSCLPRPVCTFYIPPSSPIVVSYKAPAPGEKPYRVADYFDVLEHP